MTDDIDLVAGSAATGAFHSEAAGRAVGELTEAMVREIARDELVAQIRRFLGESAAGSADLAEVEPPGLLLTVSDVVATLKVSRPTVYRLFASGELAWVQVGAHRRVAQTELDRFIAAHSCSGAA